MSKTFKDEVDSYYTKKYSQLESTTSKIIKKHNRTLEASNVISFAYLYIIEKETEVKDFSRRFTKSLEHTIYSFTLQYINTAIRWENSTINEEYKMFKSSSWFINEMASLGDEEIKSLDFQKSTEYKHNIYSDEFIADFQKSLNKLDAICFQSFYYDGHDNSKDFSKKFGISRSSAYLTIKKLKEQLNQYIKKHKIE